MSGYGAGTGSLDGIASKLRNGASSLEQAAGQRPPAPNAGEISGVVQGLVGALSTSLAGVVEGCGAAGDAVASGRDAYEKAEQDGRTDVSNASGGL
ncbi:MULTISPECIES: hypothetical protein [Prauserella salsuginis group]|uniref:Excreted virulence factor EspC (Type VII ESX diderm) n=2 Tax=Prauserella salsuginis group TaxID=2893672 RepID=A0A839XN14_9PSEU|nr:MULTISPECIES: hypothetical protein [Prauserella salsuginis group]MBB3662884.1 hypothetical protein [Prauserella sediminis]MCR3720581.1 hypothetical protein [Prauserella flava]MCR3733709.1 hypothetical protein [Prauserella salsuginis]